MAAQQEDKYYSNAEEADHRIWRHAVQCNAQVILIYSPDTDVYNIGLSHMSQKPGTTYIIQLNLPHSDEKKYININNLQIALQKDPDLSNLPQGHELCNILQTLFICTGCDYISYFKFIGKATILNNFFQHASFICGDSSLGCLHSTSLGNTEDSFLSFIRLIGTCYFKKHATAFVAIKGHKTPSHLYNSIDPSLQPKERHKVWLNTIREVVSDRIISEEDRVPTVTSLWHHWLRCCWVSQMWQNSHQPDMFTSLPSPQDSGWILSPNSTYAINWEAAEVQQKIKNNIEFLTKGCSCLKGCKTLRCGCKKRQKICGPGCLCQGCKNTEISEISDSDSETDDSEGESSCSESGGEDFRCDTIEEEIITDDLFMNTYDIT